MKFFNVLLFSILSLFYGCSLKQVYANPIIVTASFIELEETKNSFCGSRYRELSVQFELSESISEFDASDGNILNIIKCYQNDFHPYAKDQLNISSGYINEHLLVLEKKDSSLIELSSYELLRNQANEKVICPVLPNQVLEGFGLELKDMAFGQSYDVDLSNASFGIRAYYERSRCYKIEGDIAKRNKGIKLNSIRQVVRG